MPELLLNNAVIAERRLPSAPVVPNPLAGMATGLTLKYVQFSLLILEYHF